MSVKELTDKEFKTISQYIETNVGIKMPDTKRLMIQSRLAARLRILQIPTYQDYLDYVFNKDTQGTELVLMIDVLTTNKTDFFREPDHFEYLTRVVIPEFLSKRQNTLKVWSAACSSGEEVYTLSMVINEFMEKNPELSSFSVLGSDISTKVLDKAYYAVYDMATIEPIPLALKKKYFLKSSNPDKKVARVKPDLRKYASYKRLNFMDDDYNMADMYDVIFCRNALIYFDKPTQEAVIRKLTKYLKTGGYLFLGHSETILTNSLPLRVVAPTTYIRT